MNRPGNLIARLWVLPLALLAASFQAAAEGLPDFTTMVEQNSPAVVNISTTQKKLVQQFKHKFNIPNLPEGAPLDEMFRRFFGDNLGGPGDDGGDSRQARSLGSGFIVSADGYILTNFHVVDEADEIIVRLSDRRELSAKVVGKDKRSDIALLKVEASGLPVVRIGRSADLKVGAWVLAIGTPYGFDHSATAGIVSALGRSLPSENYVPFIQTDVAINPGNSGGPLFNLAGEVVGVNSQIFSRTGGYMGLSFAIPIEMAMNVVDQIRTTGKVSRGWLGVLIQDVSRDLAESFGMAHPRGALVAQVLSDSPAEKADILPGDVILRFNGQEIGESSTLPPLVGASDVDKPSKLLLLRNGQEMEIAVTIGELPPEDDAEIAEGGKKGKGGAGGAWGLVVKELTEEQRKEWRLGSKGGVLVAEVGAGPAYEAGIREGDVIQMVNNTPVRSAKELRELQKSLPKGKVVAVLLMRADGPRFTALRVPE